MALKVKAKEKLQKIGTNTGGNPGSGAEGDLEGGSGFCFSTKVKENKKKLRPTSRQTLRLLKVTIFTLTN